MFKNRFLPVIGLLSLLLVAMAVAFPPDAVANSELQRGREADAARWTGLGDHYQNRVMGEAEHLRSRNADTARWEAMAEYYRSFQEAQNLSRGRAADAARWTAMAEYYLQVISA